jgi:hypothetical protein
MHDILASPRRMRIRSCYAATQAHTNLYETERPANESPVTPVFVALGHGMGLSGTSNAKKRAVKTELNITCAAGLTLWRLDQVVDDQRSS